MNKLLEDIKKLGLKRITFSIVVLIYLGFLGFINVMMFLPGNWMSAMGHFDFVYTGETHDLIHELVFALIVGTAAVGLFSQLWKPKEYFAGQLVALIAWVTMLLVALITKNFVPQPLFIIFGGLTILATILHPAGKELFNWFNLKRLNKVLLTLALVAAVPFLVLTSKNISLQAVGGGGAGFFDHKPPSFHGGATKTTSTDVESVKQQYRNYTVEQSEREGYKLDKFCLDAESFGQTAESGAMGFHATNESLLRGPISVDRPQALMFDAEGRVLGVEYEIMVDSVSKPPQLFGQTFKKLPPHPGVQHEHYALHVWFIENPNGQFADFNPKVGCPPGSAPQPRQASSYDNDVMGEEAHDKKHGSLGHYRNLAVLGLIIILLGLLSSLQPKGWKVAAWVTGFLPILLGIASVVLPKAESSLGFGWGFAAIIWGITFIVAARFSRSRK